MIPSWYAAIGPTGRVCAVQPSTRKAQKEAGRIHATKRNAQKYGSPTTAEWRRAKAAGWRVRQVSVR